MTQKLPMTSLMLKYYQQWLNTPTLLDNPRDCDKFYQFVRACIHYGRKRRSGSWLRPFLEKDLAGRLPPEESDRLIREAVSIFDCIAEYESITFPDPMVEMKTPVSVKVAMRSVLRRDGKRFYSDEDIQQYIKENFPRKGSK